LYDDGYGYDYRTCNGPGCQHHGDYQCELFWRNDRKCDSDRYWRHGPLHLQLEYHTHTDGGYGYGFGGGNPYGDHHRCGWLYDDGYGYHY